MLLQVTFAQFAVPPVFSCELATVMLRGSPLWYVVMPLRVHPSARRVIPPPPGRNRRPGPNGNSYVQLATKMFGMSSVLLFAGIIMFARLGCTPAGVMLSYVLEYVYET